MIPLSTSNCLTALACPVHALCPSLQFVSIALLSRGQMSVTKGAKRVVTAAKFLQASSLCFFFFSLPCFVAGPWRGAWIQRGHDPRQHAANLQYQTLQYDLPQAW